MPAVYSADRSNFTESEKDCSRNGINLYKSWVERALNSGPFGHFRFAKHHYNWQILIKVLTSVIGLSCLMRTILEYEKVHQIWTLFLGMPPKFILSQVSELYQPSTTHQQEKRLRFRKSLEFGGAWQCCGKNFVNIIIVILHTVKELWHRRRQTNN